MLGRPCYPIVGTSSCFLAIVVARGVPGVEVPHRARIHSKYAAQFAVLTSCITYSKCTSIYHFQTNFSGKEFNHLSRPHSISYAKPKNAATYTSAPRSRCGSRRIFFFWGGETGLPFLVVALKHRPKLPNQPVQPSKKCPLYNCWFYYCILLL